MRRHLLRSRAGQALVEYAVILALVGAGLIAVLVTLRNGIGGAYEETGTRLDAVACGMGSDAVCPSPADPGDASGPGGNGRGNHGNGNGNGGGDGSNGGGNGNGSNGNAGGNGSDGRGSRPAR